MNNSEWLAILAFLAFCANAGMTYINSHTLPDIGTALPLVLAIWSSFHASGAAVSAVNAAPIVPAPKA